MTSKAVADERARRRRRKRRGEDLVAIFEMAFKLLTMQLQERRHEQLCIYIRREMEMEELTKVRSVLTLNLGSRNGP